MTDDEVEQLIQEVRPVVEQIAKRYVRDPERALDLVQEHALVVWGLRRVLETTQNARAYVIGRMHWMGREAIKPRASQPAAHEQEGPDLLEGVACGDESSVLRSLDVQRAFDRLPSHLWVVAWLVHGEGFLVSETARRLGLPKMLAEQRLNEATLQLRTLLKDWR